MIEVPRALLPLRTAPKSSDGTRSIMPGGALEAGADAGADEPSPAVPASGAHSTTLGGQGSPHR